MSRDHDPATWAFPAWMTALDRALILQAAHAARAPLVKTEPARGRPGLVFAGVQGYATEGVAVGAVLTVCDAILAVVTERTSNRKQQGEATALVDDAIVWAARFRPLNSSPLEAFAATVREALTAQPEWAAVLLKDKNKKARNEPTREALAAERQRVVLPLLEELDWARSAWAGKAGVRPSIVLDWLAGKTTTLQPLKRQHLTTALQLALNRKVHLPD